MQVVSWNVNGIRAVERKGCLPWSCLPEADVLCVQETKAHPDQVPEHVSAPEGYHVNWHSAQRKGYSGVLIASKQAPDEVVAGCGVGDLDCEGRIITAVFDDLAVVNAYFPNSQEAGKRIDYKLAFCAAMERHLADWQKRGCHTLLMGDYNIAHRPIDLARPEANEGNPGYLPEERAWFDRYLDLGYRDVFRERNPDLHEAYTWWSYRGGARARNVGWRIDYGTTSPDLVERVADCRIRPDVHGSDHCPVVIDLHGG